MFSVEYELGLHVSGCTCGSRSANQFGPKAISKTEILRLVTARTKASMDYGVAVHYPIQVGYLYRKTVLNRTWLLVY